MGGSEHGPEARPDYGRYCPVDSLIRAAVPDYHVTWERMA